MSWTKQAARGAGARGRGLPGATRRVAAGLVLVLFLAACESPSWLDPTEVFGGPTQAPEVIDPSQAELEPGGDYPNLASVPNSRPRPSPEAQRKRLTKGLRADRGNARYSDQSLTAENTALPPALPPMPAPREPSGETAAYTTPAPPAPMPAPPTALPATPAGAVTAPDVMPEAPPLPEPELAMDSQGRASLAEGTPRIEGVAPGELVGVVYFADGADQPDSGNRKLLQDLVLLHKQRGGVLRVVGHDSLARKAPDPVDDRMAKLSLSLGRADKVAALLVDLGARRKALEVIAAADSNPVYEESNPNGAAGNRRVEIFLANQLPAGY